VVKTNLVPIDVTNPPRIRLDERALIRHSSVPSGQVDAMNDDWLAFSTEWLPRKCRQQLSSTSLRHK